MLVAISVSAAILLFVFVGGLISGLKAGGPATFLTATGQMSVPGTYSNSGVLTLTLRNSNSLPVSTISVACSTTYFLFGNCDNSLTMQYSGAVVAPGNLLPPEGTATGSSGVLAAAAQSFTGGTTYTVILTVTFVGGSTQTVPVEVQSRS